VDSIEAPGIGGGVVMNANTIGFAGLSHLGICYSLAAAARGFSVVAFDDRPGLADSLQAGAFPIVEPGLDAAWREHRSAIRYTADVSELTRCSLIFLTLDVVTDEANQSVLESLDSLIARVREPASTGTLVIMSQVPPGYCRAIGAQLHGKLFYQVETLVIGDALDRAIHPERHIVGCADPLSGLPDGYRRYLEAFQSPIVTMRFESAELCKIAINCLLVSSLSTCNTLAEICENIGADWGEIIPALRLDRRIGPHAYLSPGLGIAGGNLERDLITVQKLAAENGCDARVVAAWQADSAYRRDWVLRHLFRPGLLESPATPVLGVWGLAYKQDTHATRNSPSLALLRSLSGYLCQAYDPAAKIDAAEFPQVRVCDSALDAARDCDVLAVMTPWKEFSTVPLEQVQAAMRGRIVLDPYGVVDRERCLQLGLAYHRLGS
jgi:UDPglucose 6-dehydrogenase